MQWTESNIFANSRDLSAYAVFAETQLASNEYACRRGRLESIRCAYLCSPDALGLMAAVGTKM